MAFAETQVLTALLKLNDQMSRPLSNATGKLKGFAKMTATAKVGMANIATNTALIGVAAAGAMATFGVAATKAAMNFEGAMDLIQTQAGGTKAEVESMSKAILTLAGTVGTGPEELAAGLYHVESAGIRGAKALEVLTTAAKGAKVGQADLESVTNALVATVNSGIGGVTSMDQAMGVLNATVGAGNMRMQDLADAFSTGILATSKTFGVSIQSLGAAIADMTDQGVPAIDAATRLRMSINLLGAPTSKAAKLLKGIGVGSLDLAKKMRSPAGIAGAMQLLAKHMRGAGLIDKNGNPNTKGAQFLSQAFGGGRSSAAIMTLLGSLGKLKDKQNQINKGAGDFGKAWDVASQDVDQKAANVGAAFESLKIKLGNELLPVAGDVLTALSEALAKPGVDEMFRGLGKGLSETFRDLLAIVPKIPWSSIGDAMKLAGQGAKMALSFFTSMPPWVQTAVLTGWGLNKLTGGALGSLLSGVTKGVGEWVIGQLKGVVGINAAVVNVNGPVVGGAAGAAGAAGATVVPAGGGKGWLGTATSLIGKVFIVGLAAEAAVAIGKEIGVGTYNPDVPLGDLSWPFGGKNTPDISFGPIEHLLGGDSVITKLGAGLDDAAKAAQAFAADTLVTAADLAADAHRRAATPMPKLTKKSVATVEKGGSALLRALGIVAPAKGAKADPVIPAIAGLKTVTATGLGAVKTVLGALKGTTSSGLMGVKGATQGTSAKLGGLQSAVRGGLSATAAASRGTTSAIARKSWSTRVAVSVPISVYSTVSVRGVSIAQRVAASYNPRTRTAGAGGHLSEFG